MSTGPDGFAARVLAAAAEEGQAQHSRAVAWLEELPAVVEGWRSRWRLGPLAPLPGSIHWVGAGQRDDGSGCVLKLAVPGAPQPRAEVAWLRRVAPVGRHGRSEHRGGQSATDGLVRAVRLLDADADAGAQLLELVEPGAPLAAGLRAAAGSTRFAALDDAACEVLGRAAEAVRRPAPSPDDGGDPSQDAALGSVRRNLEELFAVADGRDRRARVLPARLVTTAAVTARALLATADAAGVRDVLLHGDLHHDNVLSAAPAAGTGGGGGGWTVIDPHGVVGPPAYELACSVYNPFGVDELAAERAAVRCERLAVASGLPHDDVRGWALVQAVLSAVWSSPAATGGSHAPGAAEDVPREVGHVLGVAERLAG